MTPDEKSFYYLTDLIEWLFSKCLGHTEETKVPDLAGITV